MAALLVINGKEHSAFFGSKTNMATMSFPLRPFCDTGAAVV